MLFSKSASDRGEFIGPHWINERIAEIEETRSSTKPESQEGMASGTVLGSSRTEAKVL
jgi:hypothetical protein